MNTTTIAATPSVQTKKDVEFTFDFDKVLKFSPSSWLAKHKMCILLSQWMSNFFLVKVTPRQAVALLSMEIILILLLIPNHPPSTCLRYFGVLLRGYHSSSLFTCKRGFSRIV